MRKIIRKNKREILKVIINQTIFKHVILQLNGFDKRTPLQFQSFVKRIVLRDLNPDDKKKNRKSLILPVRKSPLSWIGMFHMIQCFYDDYFSVDLDIYFLKRFHAIKENVEFRIDYGLNYYDYFKHYLFNKNFSVFNVVYYFIYYDYMLRDLYLLESKFGIFLRKSKFIISKELERKERALNYVYLMRNKNRNFLYSIKFRSFIAGYFDLLGNFNFNFYLNYCFKFGIKIDIEFYAKVPLHTIPVLGLSHIIFDRFVNDDSEPLPIRELHQLEINETFKKDYQNYMEVVKDNIKDENKIFKLKQYFFTYITWNNIEAWPLYLLKYKKPKRIVDHINYVHEVWWLPEGNYKQDVYKQNISLNNLNKKPIFFKYNLDQDLKYILKSELPNLFYIIKEDQKNNFFTYSIKDKFILFNDILPFFKKYLLRFSSRFIYIKYIEFILKEFNKNNDLFIVNFINILEIIFTEIGYFGVYSYIELIDYILLNSSET